MRDAFKARVPGSLSFLIGAAVLLWIVFWYAFIQKGSRTFPLRIKPQTLGEAQLKVKVWINKSAGLYYCPSSPLYGHSASGQYMSQGDALQNGYSPAMNEPCR